AAEPSSPACRWQLRRVSDLAFYGRTPKLMPIYADRPTLLGRGSQSVRPDYVLESTAQSMMPSRQHARLHPCADGGIEIEDLSVNGTYVNFVRVEKMKLVKLTPGDVLVFGHRNGVNIPHGESVPTFRSELKFIFERAATPKAEAEPSAESVGGTTKRRLSGTPDQEAGADANPTAKRPRLVSDEAPAPESAILAPLTPLPVNSLALPPATPPAAPKTPKTPRTPGGATPGSGKSRHRRGGGGRKSRLPRQQKQPQPTTVALVTAAAETAGDDAAAAIAAAAAAADAQPDEGPCALGGECSLPLGPNLLWVGCDCCLAWYHAACTSLSGYDENQLAATDFLCDRCR
ncbi:hypothetical protein BOX15_Mlig034110g1, partial [Macrostomum lignano]